MRIIEAKTPRGRILKVIMLCIIAVIFCPLLILLGVIRLRKIPKNDPNHAFLKWCLWIGSAIFIAVAVWMAYSMTKPQFGENLDSVHWLPISEAKNISYYRVPGFEAYEFDIDETEVRKVLAKQEIEEIGEPVKILRYKAKMPNTREDEKYIEIKNGLQASGINGAGTPFTILYDREHGRAYFQSGEF